MPSKDPSTLRAQRCRYAPKNTTPTLGRMTLGVLACALSVASVGCAAEVEPQQSSNRLFDGVEIQEQLNQDADAIFFVDLRQSQTYSFDQTQADIDFSHFVVQCPSMDFPVPMEDFAQTLGLSLDEEALTLWSSEFSPEGEHEIVHRSETIVFVECDDDGEDCVTYVWEIPDA